MLTALAVVLGIVAFVAYAFLSLFTYWWFVETMLDWIADHRIRHKYGLIALYRWADHTGMSEEDGGPLGLLSPFLVPLALFELGIRLLARKIRPPQLNAFLA